MPAKFPSPRTLLGPSWPAEETTPGRQSDRGEEAARTGPSRRRTGRRGSGPLAGQSLLKEKRPAEALASHRKAVAHLDQAPMRPNSRWIRPTPCTTCPSGAGIDRGLCGRGGHIPRRRWPSGIVYVGLRGVGTRPLRCGSQAGQHLLGRMPSTSWRRRNARGRGKSVAPRQGGRADKLYAQLLETYPTHQDATWSMRRALTLVLAKSPRSSPCLVRLRPRSVSGFAGRSQVFDRHEPIGVGPSGGSCQSRWRHRFRRIEVAAGWRGHARPGRGTNSSTSCPKPRRPLIG